MVVVDLWGRDGPSGVVIDLWVRDGHVGSNIRK